VVGLLVPAGLLGLSAPATAHPLGNSSTNLSSELRVGADQVVVDHLVDLAEIRTLQLMPSVDLDDDGVINDAEGSAYATSACAALPADLSLAADGRELALTPGASSLELAPGQGGLSTTRLACRLSVDLEISGPTALEFRDDSYKGRFGWREVLAVFDRTTAERSDVPTTSDSARLSAYPPDGLEDVPDVRTASLVVRPGGPALAAGSAVTSGPGALPGVDRLTSAFTDLVGRPGLTPGIAALSVLLAVVLGAGHAVAPGHGKTVMAAYLVGQEGTRRQALQLGGIVTLTHTIGVLLLGTLLLVSSTLASERVVAGLEVASGLLLAIVGGYLLRRAVLRRRATRAAAQHHHEHGHHHDHHDHHDHADSDRGDEHGSHPARAAGRGGSILLLPPQTPTAEQQQATEPAVLVEHDHGLGRHTHALPDPARPLGARSLAAMGVAGGLVPSPSALVVLLGASAIGRTWWGVLLVVAYGIGMALTLTLAGLALLRVQRLVTTSAGRGSRWSHLVPPARLVVLLPVVTASIIVLVGVGLVLRGVLLTSSFG